MDKFRRVKRWLAVRLLGFDPIPRPPRWYSDAHLLIVTPEQMTDLAHMASIVSVAPYGEELCPLGGELGMWQGMRIVLSTYVHYPEGGRR